MNAVWNSYGQLCGCPEIFKKSCKFFCRELDIRVAEVVKAYPWQPRPFQHPLEHVQHAVRGHGASVGDGNTHSLFPILHFCIFSTLIASADSGNVR